MGKDIVGNPSAYKTYAVSIFAVIIGGVLGPIVFNGRHWSMSMSVIVGAVIGFVIAFGIRLMLHRTPA